MKHPILFILFILILQIHASIGQNKISVDMGVILDSIVALKSAPDSASKNVKILHNRDLVYILEKSKIYYELDSGKWEVTKNPQYDNTYTWYKVKTIDDTTGYVFGNDLYINITSKYYYFNDSANFKNPNKLFVNKSGYTFWFAGKPIIYDWGGASSALVVVDEKMNCYTNGCAEYSCRHDWRPEGFVNSYYFRDFDNDGTPELILDIYTSEICGSMGRFYIFQLKKPGILSNIFTDYTYSLCDAFQTGNDVTIYKDSINIRHIDNDSLYCRTDSIDFTLANETYIRQKNSLDFKLQNVRYETSKTLCECIFNTTFTLGKDNVKIKLKPHERVQVLGMKNIATDNYEQYFLVVLKNKQRGYVKFDCLDIAADVKKRGGYSETASPLLKVKF